MKPLFINQIRVLRAKSNLSQEELANKVGVRRETVGNLEAGKYNPSLLLAMDIAAVFGVTVEEVFQRTNAEEKHRKQ